MSNGLLGPYSWKRMAFVPGRYLSDSYYLQCLWAFILNRFFLQIASSANVSLLDALESRVPVGEQTLESPFFATQLCAKFSLEPYNW